MKTTIKEINTLQKYWDERAARGDIKSINRDLNQEDFALLEDCESLLKIRTDPVGVREILRHALGSAADHVVTIQSLQKHSISKEM